MGLHWKSGEFHTAVTPEELSAVRQRLGTFAAEIFAPIELVQPVAWVVDETGFHVQAAGRAAAVPVTWRESSQKHYWAD